MQPLLPFEWICMIPVIGGSVYFILCLIAFFCFQRRPQAACPLPFAQWPPVTLLKPVKGLEKNQRANFRSACLQDYPEFQAVFSVQDPDDPAIPLLREIENEFGRRRVSVVVENREAGPNGKINNLSGALPHARYDILVISDSDMLLDPNYLKAIVAPLADPAVGYVCTLYRAVRAERWFERMGLLSLNSDFIPSLIFAYLTRTSGFCLGSSMALRRESLEAIGGFESFAGYLAEDYEMGRSLSVLRKKMVLVPHFVDTIVDLKNFLQWWNFQVCWDQKTRAARPGGFFATLLLRSIPFAVLLVVVRRGDPLGWIILSAALAIRLSTAWVLMRWGMKDNEGASSLMLLPLRDLASFASWFFAFAKKTVLWRDRKFKLTLRGRLVVQEQKP